MNLLMETDMTFISTYPILLYNVTVQIQENVAGHEERKGAGGEAEISEELSLFITFCGYVQSTEPETNNKLSEYTLHVLHIKQNSQNKEPFSTKRPVAPKKRPRYVFSNVFVLAQISS
jgi:hypothetical protein